MASRFQDDEHIEPEQLIFGQTVKLRPNRSGPAAANYGLTSSILTPATGFMGDYDFTLNPYSGCSYGCTYCYAAFFVRDQALQDDWGRWVKVKSNAAELLRRRRRSLANKTIYMSSVTDPYQPIERHLRLTREILEAIVDDQPRLVIQTRSGLVERDIDVLRRFNVVQVNMTVTTDSEVVRRAFEPAAPTLAVRLRAISNVAAAGIRTKITMTPLLPVDDPELFAERLLSTGVEEFVVQPFHATRGRFVAGTGDRAKSIASSMGWDGMRHREVVDVLQRVLPSVTEGQEGFGPA